MNQTQIANNNGGTKEEAEIELPVAEMPTFRGVIEIRRVDDLSAIRFARVSDFLDALSKGDIQRLFIANFPGQGLQLSCIDEKSRTIYETNLNAGQPGSRADALMHFDLSRAVELASKRCIELVDGLCRLFSEKHSCFICFQPDLCKQQASQSPSFEGTLESWKRLVNQQELTNTSEISIWNREGHPTTVNLMRSGVNYIINLPATEAATLQSELVNRGFRVSETTGSEPWVKLLTKYG